MTTRPFREEGILKVETEDGGAAIIGEFPTDQDTGMFVRVQSWDPECQHTRLKEFLGRRIRLTIEVIED